jgi:hypothetical protein
MSVPGHLSGSGTKLGDNVVKVLALSAAPDANDVTASLGTISITGQIQQLAALTTSRSILTILPPNG